MKKVFLFSICLSFVSCSSTIRTNMTAKKSSNLEITEVTVLKQDEEVPPSSKKIGSTKFGESGFSVNCSLDYVLDNARKIAKDYGADVVKITNHKRPNLWSTCHRLTVDYYITPKKTPNNDN